MVVSRISTSWSSTSTSATATASTTASICKGGLPEISRILIFPKMLIGQIREEVSACSKRKFFISKFPFRCDITVKEIGLLTEIL
jgi:hypothetical protein